MQHHGLARRSALWMLAAASGSALLPGRGLARTAAPGATLDPADRLQRFLAFRKLAHSMDGTLTFSWLRGRRYGLSGGVLHPFWDMHVGSMFKVRDLPDGTYKVTTISRSFYADPASGEPITVFRNPLTGKSVPIRFFPPVPRTEHFGPDGPIGEPGGVTAGLTRQLDFARTWIEGDDVFVTNSVFMHGEIGGRPAHVNDLGTLSGSVADILDAARPNPPATMNFTDANSWPPWLEMGDVEGSFVSVASGRKAFAWSEMPAFWRQEMTRLFPRIAADPEAALAG